MTRTAQITRKTKETDINLLLGLDGAGNTDVKTGIPFLDHMLTLLAVHGFFDLTLRATGDLEVDAHHTVEDVGICLGLAFKNALGDLGGIKRYGNATVPMEEALASVDLDICRRPFLAFQAQFPCEKIGAFDTELVEEFLRAFATNAGVTLHVRISYGKNCHHMAEAVFKALGKALDVASSLDTRLSDNCLSSKGTL